MSKRNRITEKTQLIKLYDMRNDLIKSLKDPYRKRFIELLNKSHNNGKFDITFANEFRRHFAGSRDVVHQTFIQYIKNREDLFNLKKIYKNNQKQNQKDNNMNTTGNFTLLSYDQCKEFVTQREHELGTEYFNRDIKKAHVKRISETMPDSLKTMSPILVNTRTGHVLDGQHRITAFILAIDEERIGNTELLPARLVNVPKEEELKIIKACNVNVVTWGIKDHVRSSQEENPHIRRVMAFAQGRSRLLAKSGPKASMCFMYVCGCSESFIKDSAKLADFEVSNYNLELAATLYTEITSIFDALDFDNADTNVEKPLVNVWRTRRHEFPMDKWIQGFKKFKTKIKSMHPKKVNDWNSALDTVGYYLTRNA
jgi:hypothetical protein